MPKLIDLTGKKFGKLKVIDLFERTIHGKYKWNCECNCGNKCIIPGDNMRCGKTNSCGCIRKENGENTFLDLVGKKFGKLLVIQRIKKLNGGKCQFLCKCDCGNEKIILSNSLMQGKTKSCGCISNTIGYGKASFNNLYNSYRNNAKNRNLIFELSKDDFLSLTQQNCYYCGIEPKQIYHPKNNIGEYIYNGIDRIDSNKGYYLDNCVPSCFRCNEGKMDEIQSDFKAWIEKVYNHFVKGENNDM